MKLFLTLAAILLVSCSTLNNKKKSFLGPTEVILFQIGAQSIFCEEAIEEPCGLYAYKCVTGLSYKCVQSAAVFDLNTFKDAEKAGISQ